VILDKFTANYSNRKLKNNFFSCQSPSNIALVKYWGKSDPQIPKNASISFTLNNCHTSLSIEVQEKMNKDDFSFEVWFEGALKESFRPKIATFFERITAYIPFLEDFHFVLRSENSFPHSSGIASSASSMSAIAHCLMQIESELNPEITDTFFNEKTSFLARLGSGSACRSVEGPLVVWGKLQGIKGSSDLYGVKFPYKVDPVFEHFQDTILLIDKGEKQVSSTLGHNLMNGHPFAEQRFAQANENLEKLSNILQSGDLEGFMALVESEALTLHAMMMTSDPYFILMRPGTLEVIERVWAYRKKTGNALCFTLDAGANVHLLYPESQKDEIMGFIQSELIAFCQNNHYIRDCTGVGIKTL